MTVTTQSAMPAPPPNPFLAMVDNPCEALRALKAAQYQLLSGTQTASVRFADQEVRFSRANIEELRLLISKLSAECDWRRGRKRSARIGPHARWLAPRWGYWGY